MERQLQHRRLQHEAIAASTATTLYGALVYLNRGGLCKEPLSPAMFARPNLKGLQAVLHLLHHRIRGAARTKKELQHVYPVLEPGQGREFKAVMQGWIRELGEAGLVLPDTVKYFVTAYQGSNSHRTVLMLLDLSTVALGRELGEGPQAGLPGVELVQPHAAAVVGRLPRGARQAAAAAQRELQARMDEVVAAMQRLKQLQAQAAGQLAAGHAASGAAAAQLAPHVPPLFSASQAAARRGELVLELLSHGPPLTVQPEAVRPDSWADLLAAGKAGVATGEGAAASPAVAARRLSNPAQEASNFAAEGLAADADVITVHGVLTQRLHAAGAALQAAVSSGAPPGAPEVQATLAEAAVYRESLMLSVWQELAAAQIRSEQRAPAGACGGGSSRPALLRLLPPSQPPCNPVLEGLQAAQAAAAVAAPDTASDSCGWATPEPREVQALRRAMWQLAEEECGGTRSQHDGGTLAPSPCDQTDAYRALSAEPASPLVLAGSTAAAGSSTSKAGPGARQPPGQRISSPSLADMLSNSSGLAALPLLSEGLDELPAAVAAGLPSPQDTWPHSRQHEQQQGSPCMAESCASASIMGGHGQHSNGSSADGAGRMHAGGSRPQLLAGSPMLSAAASFMPPRRQHLEQQGQSQGCSRQPHAASSCSLPPLPATSPPHSPLSPLHGGALSPATSSPAAFRQLVGSTSQDVGSPAVPWRQAALAAAASAGAASSPSAGSSRRRTSSITVTLTPPKRLAEDSPLPLPPQPIGSLGSSPIRMPGGSSDGGSSGAATPVSKLFGGGSGSPWQGSSPASSPVLQPTQQQRQWARGPAQNSRAFSPGDALLASCLKSKGGALAPSPFASPAPSQDQQQEPLLAADVMQGQHLNGQWMLAAARSTSPAATPVPASRPASPRLSGGSGGSMGRRRSAALHTTSSPAARQQPHRLASSSQMPVPAGRAAEGPSTGLLSPPRCLDTPTSHSLLPSHTAAVGRTCREQQEGLSPASTMLTPPRSLMASPETVGRGSFAAGGGGQAGTADSGGMSIDALMQRLKLLPSKGPR